MEIQTKYNLGDEVYYLGSTRVLKGEIISVTVHEFWGGGRGERRLTSTRYSVDGDEKREDEVFSSGEDLIAKVTEFVKENRIKQNERNNNRI